MVLRARPIIVRFPANVPNIRMGAIKRDGNLNIYYDIISDNILLCRLADLKLYSPFRDIMFFNLLERRGRFSRLHRGFGTIIITKKKRNCYFFFFFIN